jgi:hypothetical protein
MAFNLNGFYSDISLRPLYMWVHKQTGWIVENPNVK